MVETIEERFHLKVKKMLYQIDWDTNGQKPRARFDKLTNSTKCGYKGLFSSCF